MRGTEVVRLLNPSSRMRQFMSRWRVQDRNRWCSPRLRPPRFSSSGANQASISMGSWRGDGTTQIRPKWSKTEVRRGRRPHGQPSRSPRAAATLAGPIEIVGPGVIRAGEGPALPHASARGGAPMTAHVEKRLQQAILGAGDEDRHTGLAMRGNPRIRQLGGCASQSGTTEQHLNLSLEVTGIGTSTPGSPSHHRTSGRGVRRSRRSYV